ncbi:hypothetical protein PP641_gp069 [Arthrobacter phage SilentRX]|uniref:Uncharacterized protein n=1 Tax=Arthrobacter phage SilentRX TaxID=2836091 RepID=A0A8F3IPP9_9CAUD|nr:hypothetical protein PP641_gp069 [Arthrobacter phage SilentRX]QWY82809.1 hypothetical protein SEA_SILENTRX_69 [Arthrobacter phage SilentRX]
MATPTSKPATRAGKGKERPDPEALAAANNETIQQLKNRLRGEAEREVLNNHKDEFHEIATAKFAEVGLEFVRRLTDEEKAAKQIEELYEKYPNLRPTTVVTADTSLIASGGWSAPAAAGQTDEFGTEPGLVEAREGE